MRNKLSLFFYCLGGLLILSAGLLTLYNFQTQDRAAQDSAEILTTLSEQLPDSEPTFTPPVSAPGEYMIADHLLNPDMPMPAIEVDGVRYIGTLTIPRLELSLPIAAALDDATLMKAPCHYEGTAYKGNFVIAGHNYRRHFGRIYHLQEGDRVEFTDADGNLFPYTTVGTEILTAKDRKKLLENPCDLTLFTCTLGGQNRIAVRCVRASEA